MFLLGATIGVIINDIPFIHFKKEIGITDIAAIFIAIGIPIWVNKWIDHTRYLKSFIIDELRVFLKYLNDIEAVIQRGYENKESPERDKRQILVLFQRANLQLASTQKHIDRIYPAKFRDELETLKNLLLDSKQAITGEDLMKKTFAIDLRFANFCARILDKLASKVKEQICHIDNI